jgi:hypothetical protein
MRNLRFRKGRECDSWPPKQMRRQVLRRLVTCLSCRTRICCEDAANIQDSYKEPRASNATCALGSKAWHESALECSSMSLPLPLVPRSCTKTLLSVPERRISARDFALCHFNEADRTRAQRFAGSDRDVIHRRSPVRCEYIGGFDTCECGLLAKPERTEQGEAFRIHWGPCLSVLHRDAATLTSIFAIECEN